MTDKKDQLIGAAIDIGITFSGYAYALKDDHMRDPFRITTSKWMGDNLLTSKGPTCVLLSPRQEFMAFGYEAENMYSKLILDEKHFDYYFFEGFIISLYETRSTLSLSRNMLIKDVKGKEVPALDLFAHVIRYLKDHAFRELERRTGLFEIFERDIHWVLPVPAIWNNSAKQFIREAAHKAGILTEQLTICLEPEASIMYCQQLQAKMLIKEYNPGTHSLRPLTAETKTIVIDLGGKTAEITVYQKQSDGTLRELHRPTGGLLGGTKVNEAFERMIKEIFGSKSFEKFKEDCKYDYIHFCRKFETKKRSIILEYGQRMCIAIPWSLLEKFKEERGSKDIKEVIQKTCYADKINLKGFRLTMGADLFKGFFREPVNMLVEHLKELMAKDNLSEISTLLMVGNFSESPIMQDAIKNAFPDKNVIVPEDAGLAVLKGAVLFGHQSGAVPESIPPGLL